MATETPIDVCWIQHDDGGGSWYDHDELVLIGKAECRALAAIQKHGSLVRDKHWAGCWRIPGAQGAAVCGTGTIRKLERHGLVRVDAGIVTAAVPL